jgi:molybdate transport repressor ModE-like protein
LANGAILDPAKIALLGAIETKGSISAAARSLEISHGTGWQSVKTIDGMLCSGIHRVSSKKLWPLSPVGAFSNQLP